MRLGRSIHDAFACNSRDPCFDHAAARNIHELEVCLLLMLTFEV
jgi:hypothetical protein